MLSDAQVLFSSYSQDSEVTKYLTWKPHKNIAETSVFLKNCIKDWESAREYSWVIEKKENHKIIGMIRLGLKSRKTDFGYILAKPYWGNGYATEALKAIINLAFSQLNIKTIKGTCDLENIASGRVMEKAGLRFQKVLKKHVIHPNISSEARDLYLYSIHKNAL